MCVILALPESIHLSPTWSIPACPGAAKISLNLMQRKICASVFLFTQLSERTFNTKEESSLLIRVVELPTACTAETCSPTDPGHEFPPACDQKPGRLGHGLAKSSPWTNAATPWPWLSRARCLHRAPPNVRCAKGGYVHLLSITLGDMLRDF